MGRGTRDDELVRVEAMKKLFLEGAVVNAEQAAKALNCSPKTARADWALMKAVLNKETSDWANEDALREITEVRRKITKEHVKLHDTAIRAATTPTAVADEDGNVHVPEPVDGCLNLDAVPAVVAIGKLVNEDLKGLQDLFSIQHTPEAKPPLVGEKDGKLHVGGDQPIPVEDVPKVLKQIAPPEKLQEDDEPTAEDIGG